MDGPSSIILDWDQACVVFCPNTEFCVVLLSGVGLGFSYGEVWEDCSPCFCGLLNSIAIISDWALYSFSLPVKRIVSKSKIHYILLNGELVNQMFTDILLRTDCSVYSLLNLPVYSLHSK